MWSLELVQRLDEAEDDTQRIGILRAVYESCVQERTEKTVKEVAGEDSNVRPSTLPEKEAFLQGYLRPYGLFPQAILALACECEGEEQNVELQDLVDRFFVDVHPIYAVDALIKHLGQSSDEDSSVRHVWKLLKRILLDDFDRGCAALWEVEIWQRIFPDKTWEQCSDWIVGWFVTLAETSSKTEEYCAAFHSPSLLPRVIEALMKGHMKDLQDAGKHPRLQLLGSCLRRFLNRGNGLPLTTAVVDQCNACSDMGISFFPLVQSIRDPHAKEKFFQQLLFLLSRDFEEEQAIRLLRRFSLSSEMARIADDAYYILFHRILFKEEMPCKVAKWIVSALIEEEDKLMKMAQYVAKTWADEKAIDCLSIPRQAYLTFLLTSLLSHLPGIFAEVGDAMLRRSLLAGVSHHLESCVESIRCQGMRVAHAMASRQPDTDPIFSDVGLDFQSLRTEEQWEYASEEMTQNPSGATAADADSDDESDFSDTLDESDSQAGKELPKKTDSVLMGSDHPITLMELHQDLKKSDEPLKVINALKNLSILIKECPSELPGLATELSRTLIHVPLPDWIGEELRKDNAHALKGLKTSSAVRVCCLTLLLTAAPVHCGDSIAMMICSRQVAEHQRLEILESMREAAKQLSAPPDNLTQKPMIEAESTEISGKARIWGVRSLATKKRNSQIWRNRYVDVAGLWVSSLLLACQRVTHGFNIMEQNPMVLGAVLVTLGTFAECASQSIVSISLALSAFPLIRLVVEQKSENCYLRRCSLQAMTAMIQSLPAGRLSVILSGQNLIEMSDETDTALRDMLLWIKLQGERIFKADQDETCRHLAAHCLHTYARAAKAALELKSSEDVMSARPQEIRYRIPEKLPILPVDKGDALCLKQDKGSVHSAS